MKIIASNRNTLSCILCWGITGVIVASFLPSNALGVGALVSVSTVPVDSVMKAEAIGSPPAELKTNSSKTNQEGHAKTSIVTSYGKLPLYCWDREVGLSFLPLGL